VAEARDLLPALPLIAHGKSFGGRMTSRAQTLARLTHVRSLCLFGFPLHILKQASTSRADHLSTINIPTVFLQGTRDAMTEPSLKRGVVERLFAPVTLKLIDHVDLSHSSLRPQRDQRHPTHGIDARRRLCMGSRPRLKAQIEPGRRSAPRWCGARRAHTTHGVLTMPQPANWTE
jgi:hypothetical protein